MKSKLEKILAQCSFLSDEQLSTIRKNGTLFDTIPPSKGFLRRLSENAMSFDEKLDLLKGHKKILVGLPSSCLALLFSRSVNYSR